MMATAPAAAEPGTAAPGIGTPAAPPEGVSAGLSRFHLVVLAFQRAKQLQHGARPRVDVESRRPTRVAMAEVLADTVSWTITEKASEPELTTPASL